jgi:hypothetical protein
VLASSEYLATIPIEFLINKKSARKHSGFHERQMGFCRDHIGSTDGEMGKGDLAHFDVATDVGYVRVE